MDMLRGGGNGSLELLSVPSLILLMFFAANGGRGKIEVTSFDSTSFEVSGLVAIGLTIRTLPLLPLLPSLDRRSSRNVASVDSRDDGGVTISRFIVTLGFGGGRFDVDALSGFTWASGGRCSGDWIKLPSGPDVSAGNVAELMVAATIGGLVGESASESFVPRNSLLDSSR